jgi:replicative DNA helicase
MPNKHKDGYWREYRNRKKAEGVAGVAQHPYPAAVDLEKALLGALVIAPEKIPDVAETLSPEDFYLAAHGEIYKTLLEMHENGEGINLPLLVNQLQKRQLSVSITEIATIVANNEAVPAFAPIYAREITEKAHLRNIMLLCERVAGKCAAHEFESLEELQNELLAGAVNVRRGISKTLPAKEVMLALAKDIDERYHTQEQFTGLSTGLRDLDKLLGGLHKGDLITIGGRPSMGKSSLASCILLAAAKAGKAVIIFSTEVDALRLARRLVAQEAMIDTHKFRRPKQLTEVEFMQVARAQAELARLNIFINDHPSPTPGFIRGECLRVKAQGGTVDLVIVDYIGLLAWTGRVENRNLELGKISASLKGLARELDCPVVVLSQLNRAVESRQDKRPKLLDLRESGSIEQDSDVVIGLYRPEYYDPNDRPGEVEIIVLKNRDGPTGSVWATFLKEYTVFKDKADEVH